VKVSNGHILQKVAPEISALVLAAGYSSRMGQFKPLLPIGSSTVIETVVRLFHSAGIPNVYVVLGYRAHALLPVAAKAGANCVINHRFDEGMYSSVRAGVAALATNFEACFIMPVDIPLVCTNTIHQLVQCYNSTRKSIIYPVFRSLRGHPPLVSCKILAETIQGGPYDRLSALLSAHEREACNVDVSDEAIHRDIDTPNDFVELCVFAAKNAESIVENGPAKPGKASIDTGGGNGHRLLGQ
jgi:molybdenum cofactor cytidylyltransferase